MGDLVHLPAQPATAGTNPRRHRRHTCCPNAEVNLVGYPRRDGRSVGWKLTLRGQVDGCETRLVVPVIYCPWCGDELDGER